MGFALKFRSTFLTFLALLALQGTQNAQACVDWGVNAYFAKNDASDEDFSKFIVFIQERYPVKITIEEPNEVQRYFISANPEMAQSEAVCFSETWALLNNEKSRGIVWNYEYQGSNEVFSHCDKFFDELVAEFQKKNNIPVDTGFYKGC